MYLGATQPANIVLGKPSAPTPSWLTSAFDIGKTALQIKQQRDIQKINIQRLSQGLPALNADEVATQVKVGVDTGQLNKILWVAGGAVAIGALIFLLTRKK